MKSALGRHSFLLLTAILTLLVAACTQQPRPPSPTPSETTGPVLAVLAEDGTTLGSDKLDYDPGETVTINAAGFTPNTSYDVIIVRPDGSIIKGDGNFNEPDHTYTCPDPESDPNSTILADGSAACWDSVLTDEAGSFSYAYILNGIEGQYWVYIYLSTWSGDLDEEPVAFTRFYDAAGDFSIDFVAAAPLSYNHLTGGGAYDDRTVGAGDDVVESLTGGDYTCGDILTFLPAITVKDTATAESDGPQTLELDFSFLADATGSPGAGIGKIVNVEVNYHPIQDLIAGENSVDEGVVDDGGSSATLKAEYLTGPLFTAGSELIGTVEVDDLEAREVVIVRLDVKLYCQPGASPTGNLQAKLDAVRLVEKTQDGAPVAVDPPEEVAGGAQTIPFKQIGNISFPELTIAKTVTTEDGSCGVDDVDSLAVDVGSTVRYCYTVSDAGDAPLYNVFVHDDAATPGDPSDDFTVSLTGLSDLDGDGTADDLPAGGSATGEALVTFNTIGTYVNTALATGADAIVEPILYSDSDTASVTVQTAPFSGQFTVSKLVDTQGNGYADTDTLPEPGGSASYQITVSNDYGQAVTLTDLVDDKFGDLNGQGDCSLPQDLAANGQAGDSYSCTFSADLSGQPGDEHLNVVSATVNGPTNSGSASFTKTDTATVTFFDLPSALWLSKTTDVDTLPEPGGEVTFTVTFGNSSSVDEMSITSLDDSVYGDLNGMGDCAVPQTLAPLGSYSCSFTASISGNAGFVHQNTATAAGTDDDGSAVEASDDATVTLTDVASSLT
ncbi:MAG: hypothetical protein JSV66_04300, partial [Trueperaceae bacterium]